MSNSHIDVTFDLAVFNHDRQIDLRIPTRLSVKQLLVEVMETLKLETPKNMRCAIKVKTKEILILDDDMLIDYPITDGDILTVL